MNITLTDEHKYIDLDTGSEYPGVTTAIKAAGLMGYMPNDPWYMERGTAVHAATAYYDRGTLDEDTLDPRIIGYLRAWKEYRLDSGYSPAIIERSLYHGLYQYCGTIDRDGIDIKTGGPCAWHLIQAGAYYELQKYANIAMPTIWRTIHLYEDGEYKIQPYTLAQLREGFGMFQHALAIYNWRKNHGINNNGNGKS